MSVHLTINGHPIEADADSTVLEAALLGSIEIPTLCYHRDLSLDGSCRLCLVEIDGLREPVAACTYPVADGMTVRTETEDLAGQRKAILEMLLADYVDPPDRNREREETEFERWVQHYGAQRPAWARAEPRYSVDSDPNPFVYVDLNKCILCTRCVRACEEVQARFVWGVAERGRETHIVAGADETMLGARCESCGACAAYCPTGALADRPSLYAGRPDALVRTTCPYCGVGCQFDLNVKDGRLIRVTSDPDAPVNGMSLCVKGRYGYDFVHHPDRLRKPRVRQSLLTSRERKAKSREPEWTGSTETSGSRLSALRTPLARRPEDPWVEVDWDTALDFVAETLCAIRNESGPDALGVLSSAKCSNEENYLMQKLARQVIGTHNVDHCARLCHSSTVAGLAMAFGSGAMSNSMDDVARQAQAMLIIGSNTTEQHPVFGTMIRQAVLRRGVKLIVADPRRIDITEFAALHLQHKPGTDVALLNGLMYLILSCGLHDEPFIRNRCEGFEEFEETVSQYPPETVSEITGVPVNQLQQAAEILGRSKPAAVIWAMGITQHTTGVLNVLSLANLQMLLGNMGVPGGGVNPLRGQNNVQGACDMGALPNVFPGYQPVTDNAVLQKFESAWALQEGVESPESRVQSQNSRKSRDDRSEAKALNSGLSFLDSRLGLTVTEMIDAAGEGSLRGLYILGENPVMTDPDSNHVRRCLESAEFVVLQEIFPSETARYADVLLPGTSWAERTGTFTNTDRRIQLFREAIPPQGDSRPDWQIVCDLAQRMMQRQNRTPAGPHAGWNYVEPAQIMAEIAALTPSYAGVSYRRLDQGERLQWPVIGPEHRGTPILHVGEFTRGKGTFHAVDHLPAEELPDDEYPLLLTTGRVLYHWHGGEMTRRVQGLLDVYPETLVEVSPEDAARLGIEDGGVIRLQSRRGEMQATAVVTNRVAAGVVFGNFHFPAERNVNNLTIAALDPVAKIPEYKVCAVRMEWV